jgi:hypothetical protein
MNLWAKTLGRLAVLAVALFFFACADETSLVGLKNPNPRFNVSFVEIPIESSVLSIDSIYTDNKGTVGGLLVGNYQDNIMGNVHSEAYLQIVPNSGTLIQENAIYDSLTVQFRFNFYSYGFTDEHTEKFTIHEITGNNIPEFVADSLNMYALRSVASSSIAFNPTPIAETFVNVDYDSLTKQLGLEAAQQDTLTARARLTDDMGQRIFDKLQTYEFKKNNPDVAEFIKSVKGLVLVPSQSSGILGIRLGDALTRVTLHYHTVTNGTTSNLTRNFPFSIGSFSNIVTDRSSSDLAGLTQSYQDFQPGSGKRYLQSGTPVITKLDLSKFYEVADTMENVIVNEAELIISDVESPSGINAHSSLVLKPMHQDNRFFNIAVANDSVIRSNYVFPIVSSTDPLVSLDVNYKHFFVNSDVPSQTASAARLLYSSSDKNYSTFITLFTQTLFENKQNAEGVNPNRLKYLALFPATPSVLHTVNRTVFSADKIKLRIYYTTPTVNQIE